MAYQLALSLANCADIFLMLRWFENSQVYHPDRLMVATGAELGRPFENVRFAAADGTELHGWYFAADSSSHRSRLAVLVCHGNGGNISHRLDLVQALLETGVSVFLFDYRGYGQSRGRPSERGTYLDAQAAHHWLQKRGVPGANIVAFGESLGGGVASELAVREPLAGLVLQGTFTCLPDIGAELYPWLPVRLIGSIQYDTCSKLPRLKIPVLVMHSRTDGLIGFHHAEKNFACANEPKLFCELAGDHNDAVLERKQFIVGFEKFLSMLEPAKAGQPAGP